jgi:hypothetical protein
MVAEHFTDKKLSSQLVKDWLAYSCHTCPVIYIESFSMDAPCLVLKSVCKKHTHFGRLDTYEGFELPPPPLPCARPLCHLPLAWLIYNLRTCVEVIHVGNIWKPDAIPYA